MTTPRKKKFNPFPKGSKDPKEKFQTKIRKRVPSAKKASTPKRKADRKTGRAATKPKSKNRFIKTSKNLTVVIGDKSKVISSTHCNFKKVLGLVQRGRWKDAAQFLNIGDIVKNVSSGAKRILKKIPNVEDRIGAKAICELKEGRDPEFKAFLKRCKKNPNQDSIDQLLNFLQYINAPFTKEGTFLGYKSVRSDFKDHYSGKVDNTPGKTISMDRKRIKHDRNICSDQGYHVGSLHYASTFVSQGKILLVEVDPMDVVAVPKDYFNQKMRVCRYKVIKEIGYPTYEN